MATEYGITSFTLAGDVGRGTSVWFMGTTRQKSCSRWTTVDADQDKRDKRNTVKRITKSGWSRVQIQTVCNAAIEPLTTQYFPQILHTVRIYKATSLQYSPFQTLLPPYKDSTSNLSTHITRKSWLGCTTCIFHWAAFFQLLSK